MRHLSHDGNSVHLFNTLAWTGNPDGFHLRATKKRAKTAACSITGAACEVLRVGIAHKSEALEKLREEIKD